MKTIKCIKEVSKNENICTSITIGQSYKILQESEDDYLIKDDINKERYYLKEFFEACGIETEKTFKGSELQYWDSFDKEWNDCNKVSKYRLKPDHFKEIAELERQIQILKNK